MTATAAVVSAEPLYTQIEINLSAAIRAVRQSLGNKGLGDETLVIKTVLAETYGAVPKPWRLHNVSQGIATVLTYAEADTIARASLALPALQQACSAIQVAIPDLHTQQRLRFHCRFVPTIRQKGRERDAFLAALDRNAETTRAETYTDYLKQRLNGADLEDAQVKQFALRKYNRPTHQADRPWKQFTLPLVELSGTLTVTDPAMLREILLRGIGRHRTYGAGYLHLEAEK